MKLILCISCSDIRALRPDIDVVCFCGKSKGRYVNEVDAAIEGDAVPLGFANSSFVEALRYRPQSGQGERFTAFVIPQDCPTIDQTRTTEKARTHGRRTEKRPDALDSVTAMYDFVMKHAGQSYVAPEPPELPVHTSDAESAPGRRTKSARGSAAKSKPTSKSKRVSLEPSKAAAESTSAKPTRAEAKARKVGTGTRRAARA